MKKMKRVRLLVLTPFEKNKVQWIGEMMKEGLNPLRVTYSTVGSDTRFTARDLRNYHYKQGTPFFAVLGKAR